VAHIDRDGRKLLARVRRIRGQIQGIEKALEGESDCTSLLQTIAATRGALNGLMAQIVEGHIREHVIDPSQPPTPEQVAAADELVDVVKAYLK
jgi:DNA-binding FrmR family transcriptional regulator